MDFPIKEALGAAATLSVALLGYRQWKRTKRSGKFLEDREAAYKQVWTALEDVHLLVRTQSYTSQELDNATRGANTLLIQLGLHISEKDKALAAEYLRALKDFGALLAQLEAAHPARHDIATTGEGVAMPPSHSEALKLLEDRRSALMRGFRAAIGAGQI